jgi:predicted nucleic acid-binding protein
MRCVLDASISLAWLLKDAGAKSEAYAFNVLSQMRSPEAEVYVPAIWGLEMANVLARSEAKAFVTPAQSEGFLEMLAAVPIQVDVASVSRSLAEILQIARRYGLSSYDASYLDLALRLGLPLATLDADLMKAAKKAGVASLPAA